MDIFSFTSEGGRDYNEDSIGYSEKEDRAIFVLADGLGGHEDGAVASDCVVDAMLGLWEEHPDYLTDVASAEFAEVNEQDTPEQTWFKYAISEANHRVLDKISSTGKVMKSTVCALRIDGQKATWAHVGDSRLYFIHNSHIESVTEDHSVAYKKYRGGEISRHDINTDEDQPSLLRSIGGEDRNTPDVERFGEVLGEGDGFLLCSDGLWEYLYDHDVVLDYLKADTAREWGELLLERVIDKVDGTNDNLSVIAVKI